MLSVLCVVMLSAAPVHADLKAAIVLFEDVELEKAEPILAELVKRPGLSAEDRAVAWQYLAATHFALGKKEAARADVEALVAFAPDYQMDPRRTAAELRAMHEAALAARTPVPPKETPQTVVVTPEPTVTPPAEPTQVMAAPEQPSGSSKVLPISLIGGGAVLAAAGTWKMVSLTEEHNYKELYLKNKPYDQTLALEHQNQSKLSFAGVMVGAAAVVAGVALLVTGDEEESPAVSMVPVNGGGVMSVSGRF